MIKIICVGSIKEKYFKDAIEEYKKRLSKYTKLEIIELKDSKLDNKELALREEEERILKVLKQKDHIISMAIEGKQYDSIDFSNHIDKLLGIEDITFIIGGSYGIPNSIKEISNEFISFSKMTFPHQLFRIILLEQLYRSFKILNNETYHK